VDPQRYANPLTDDPLPAWRRDPVSAANVTLASGCFGTVIAGGLFPIALSMLLLIDPEWASPYPDKAALLATLGIVFGVFFAAWVGFFLFIIAGVAQTACGLHRRCVAIAAMPGGWTGFVANYAVSDSMRSAPTYIVLAVAMVMGQLGGGWGAAKARRRMAAAVPSAEPSSTKQFRLRELFGVTTAVAVLAAVVAAWPLTPHCRQAIGFGAGMQAVTLGGWFLLRRTRRRRIVSRETI
jgi:hypothetical protein